MNALHTRKENTCRRDLCFFTGTGVLLTIVLYALYLALYVWFTRSAAVPTDWNPILFGRG